MSKSKSTTERGLLQPHALVAKLTCDRTRKKPLILIRQVNCRVLVAGSVFSLLETGHERKNSDGAFLAKVSARVRFLRNRFIDNRKFDNFAEMHKLSGDDYAAIKNKWKHDKPHCIGWEIELVEVLDTPFWIPVPGSSDDKAKAFKMPSH